MSDTFPSAPVYGPLSPSDQCLRTVSKNGSAVTLAKAREARQFGRETPHPDLSANLGQLQLALPRRDHLRAGRVATSRPATSRASRSPRSLLPLRASSR